MKDNFKVWNMKIYFGWCDNWKGGNSSLLLWTPNVWAEQQIESMALFWNIHGDSKIIIHRNRFKYAGILYPTWDEKKIEKKTCAMQWIKSTLLEYICQPIFNIFSVSFWICWADWVIYYCPWQGALKGTVVLWFNSNFRGLSRCQNSSLWNLLVYVKVWQIWSSRRNKRSQGKITFL